METTQTNWYAIRTRHDTRAEQVLSGRCQEVFFPIENIVDRSGRRRSRAVIPHVLFIRNTRSQALALEKESRNPDSGLPPFWIYRYCRGEEIQPVTDAQIRLIRLLTSPDHTRCEIYTKTDFRRGETVRVTGGFYKGYVGTVQRVRKNKHVVVEIEGICLVLLPFIHPDLLEKIEHSEQAQNTTV